MIEINTVIEMMLNHHEVFKMQHRSLKLSFNLQMARSIVLLEKQMHLPQQNFVFWSYKQFIIYHSENPSLVLPRRPVRREVIINKYLNICL